MVSLMDRLLKLENLDLHLTPYRVLATGHDEGMMEFIPSKSLAQVTFVSFPDFPPYGYLFPLLFFILLFWRNHRHEREPILFLSGIVHVFSTELLHIHLVVY